jgi:hypothetical protein
MAMTPGRGSRMDPTVMGGDGGTPDWLRLDNAAKIYPATFSSPAPAGFRLSMTLKAPIRVAMLAEALRTVLRRCPYYQVHLRRGFFWYYLQRHDVIPLLHPMSEATISAIPAWQRDTDLFRVQVRGATIAVDFSHILTDGTGGLIFLGTLVTRYLELCGVNIGDWAPFLDPSEAPSAEEYEDAHNRFFDPRAPRPARLSKAYRLSGTPEHRYRIITGRMAVTEVLERARAHGVSLTEYLGALYLFSLMQIRERRERRGERVGPSVIRLEVPVDMRRFFSSKTVRNFSLFVSPEIDVSQGSYSFGEVVQKVHHILKMQIDARELGRQIGRNVRAERHPVIRAAPLFVKDLVLSVAYQRLGEGAYSGVLTNLGTILVPTAVEPHIESFGALINPSYGMKKNCVVASFRDSLQVSFGSVVASRDLERDFFTWLAADGVHVAVSER